jgi:transposase
MAAKGLDMKEVAEILRLKSLGFSKRKIARTLGVHRNTISRHFDAQEAAKPPGWAALASPAPVAPKAGPPGQAVAGWWDGIDWNSVRDDALNSVTLNVIYEELVEKGLVPVQYPAFWKQLQRRAPMLRATMVRVFAPGSRAEIDYCDGIDLATGEALATELFVGVLCSSRYAYAEFTMSQKSCDFLSSHVRMLDFFRGVPQVMSPDNLKSAVTKAHRYDPVLNPAYTKLAAHYGFAVVPARVRTPRDKAIVERTIQIFQRWFFVRVRNRTFTSLIELNACLKEHVALFNQKTHRIFGRSRAEMFEAEREHLMPLPKDAYQVATFAKAVLSRDCHLAFERNFYSAPHTLRGLDLDVWATERAVEIFHKGERVAFHARLASHGKFATENAHYPPAHQAYLEEDVAKAKAWAEAVGPETFALVADLLDGPYPLRYLRRAQAILGLSRKHSRRQLELAAVVANRFDNKTIPFIERVIVKGDANGRRGEKGGVAIARGFNPHLRGVEKIIH